MRLCGGERQHTGGVLHNKLLILSLYMVDRSRCSGDVEDWEVPYTVGITAVVTWVADDSLPFLTNMYFGGYDLDDNEADGASFSWKGPFG